MASSVSEWNDMKEFKLKVGLLWRFKTQGKINKSRHFSKLKIELESAESQPSPVTGAWD